jgi:hypothetical protein
VGSKACEDVERFRLGDKTREGMGRKYLGQQTLKVMKIYHSLRRRSAIVVASLYLLVFLSVVVVGLGLTQTVFATDTAVIKPKGLTLSPLRTELEIAPGTSLDGVLTVTNSTDKPMTVDLVAEEFKVTDKNYDYEFIAETEVSKWATFKPSEVILKAGESRKIKYTVGAPLTAEPGGYYISLFASTIVGSADDADNSRQRVASLLYITVSSDVLGAATRVGHVLSLSSPWLVTDKGTWGMTLQNGGTTHYRSNYSIKVEDLFGGKVGDDQNSALILPSTIRALSGKLPLPSIPGVYKIIYTIGLGDVSDSTEVRYVLFLPIWAMMIIIVAIVAGGYWLFRKMYKKH